MTFELHEGDLPDGLNFGTTVAVDTETLGLNPHRDRLCVVQLSAGDGTSHLVQFPPGDGGAPNYSAARLKAVLSDSTITKLFHFARFDLAVIAHHLGVACAPVYCTKIASKLTRTYTERHGLKDLCRELLGVDLAKAQQSSDWGAPDLTPAQLRYAAEDVLHLHRLKARLDEMLVREGRRDLAEACFAFLSTRAALDLGGWAGMDIFEH